MIKAILRGTPTNSTENVTREFNTIQEVLRLALKESSNTLIVSIEDKDGFHLVQLTENNSLYLKPINTCFISSIDGKAHLSTFVDKKLHRSEKFNEALKDIEKEFQKPKLA